MNDRLKNSILALAMIAALAVVSSAQQVTAEIRSAANDAYQKKDWATAADRYQKIVSAEPKNPSANYRLGVVLLNLGRAKDAQTHLETAMTISPNSVFALALARAYAQNGVKDKVYEVFEKSIALGGIAAESLNDEKDFAALKSEPKFVEYVKKLDAAANPCRSRPEYRQFDFWIGEWAPQNVQGVTVGTSSIQLILGSCIIFENWNTPVSSGKSFNSLRRQGRKMASDVGRRSRHHDALCRRARERKHGARVGIDIERKEGFEPDDVLEAPGQQRPPAWRKLDG